MTIEDLRNYCLSLPGVKESIKWEAHLTFTVGEKMFIITSPDSVPISASFKTNEDLFEKLSARKGFMPAPYLAKNKWVHVDDIARLGMSEWKRYLDLAYQLIFEKLPAKTRRELSKG
jgi:predicted DNA-binding protein (MmcQ/YjbR family)